MLNYHPLTPSTPWIVAKPTAMGIVITNRGFTKDVNLIKNQVHDGVLIWNPVDKDLEHVLYTYNTQLSNLNKRK